MPKRRPKGVVFENLEMGIAFGKHFRAIRIEQGFSQEKLALEAGVERSTIARIEAAKMNVTVDLVFTLSLALRVFPADLFGFEYQSKEKLK